MQVVPIRSKKTNLEGKRARLKAQNRRVILDAARRVFAEMGFGAAKVRDIIRATPLAAGTFYKYFRSKEEVLQALCDEAAEIVGPAMREARQTAKSAEAFFLGTFHGLFAFIAERRARGIGADPYPRSPATAGMGELKRDIEAAIARGILPPVNVQVLASAIWGLALGLAETLPDWSSPQEAARAATSFMLSGFRALDADNSLVAVNY